MFYINFVVFDIVLRSLNTINEVNWRTLSPTVVTRNISFTSADRGLIVTSWVAISVLLSTFDYSASAYLVCKIHFLTFHNFACVILLSILWLTLIMIDSWLVLLIWLACWLMSVTWGEKIDCTWFGFDWNCCL